LNTIWSLNYYFGSFVYSFDGLAHLGKRHFHNLFKEDERVTIVDIVRMAYFFSRFVNVEDNISFMEEVSKEEIKDVLYSF
jgi:hypothetical protein